MAPDYLALGHVTRDLRCDGTTTPGGTALFAATTAARLGLRGAIVTVAADDDLQHLGLPYAARPATTSTTFENRYHAGRREQWLHAAAPPLNLDYLPPGWSAAPIVHLGPVLHECDLAVAQRFPAALIGVTPQGWMRRWDQPLPTPIRRLIWRPEPELLRRVNLLVLSLEDLDGDEDRAAGYARTCPLVALTRGAAGLTLFVEGRPTGLPALPAHEVDPTGAGDVFAAAMLVGLYETGDPFGAARFAAAVAAGSVEGEGITSIPTRAEALARFART